MAPADAADVADALSWSTAAPRRADSPGDRVATGSASWLRDRLQPGEQLLPALPSGGVRLAVGLRPLRVLALAQEAVAGALVDHRLEGLAQLLHRRLGGRQGGVDALVVAAVEAVDGGLDLRQLVAGVLEGAVEDEGGREVGAMGGEAEALPAPPAEAGHGHLPV